MASKQDNSSTRNECRDEGILSGNSDVSNGNSSSIRNHVMPDDRNNSNAGQVENVLEEENSDENSTTVQSEISHSENDEVVFARSDLPNSILHQAQKRKFEPLMHIIDKIANGERVPHQISMRYEILRLCSLRSFPKENKPYITRLAAGGFYYENTDDEVVCYLCARRKRGWCENDDPMEIHRQLNPNCSFFSRNSEVNVPMTENLHVSEIRSQSHENGIPNDTTSTCNEVSHNVSELTPSENITNALLSPVTSSSSSPVHSSNNEILQHQMQQAADEQFGQTSPSSMAQEQKSNNQTVFSSSDRTRPGSSSSALPTSQLFAEGADAVTPPKYPRYATKTARLTSFNDCGDIAIPPDHLAECGFYYAGFGDCVRCFQCGVGLRHWSDEDDPWVEHARCSKDCLFVKQAKGQEFVNLVQMAVQYSQKQNENGQTQNGNYSEMDEQTSEAAVIEQQMKSDAAQSVLENGYEQNIIRNALRALMNDGQTLTATTLMEKIFELDDESSNSLVQGVQGVQETNSANNAENIGTQRTSPDRISSTSINGVQETNSANNTENIGTQRTSPYRISSTSNNGCTQSVAVGNTNTTSEANTYSVINGMSREQSSSPIVISLHGSDDSDDMMDLYNENQRMRDQLYCIECRAAPRVVLFLSCPFPHLLFCDECYLDIDVCPVCGTPVKALLNIRR